MLSGPKHSGIFLNPKYRDIAGDLSICSSPHLIRTSSMVSRRAIRKSSSARAAPCTTRRRSIQTTNCPRTKASLLHEARRRGTTSCRFPLAPIRTWRSRPGAARAITRCRRSSVYGIAACSGTVAGAQRVKTALTLAACTTITFPPPSTHRPEGSCRERAFLWFGLECRRQEGADRVAQDVIDDK